MRVVRSASLLRKSIMDRPAGIHGGWRSFLYSNHVPVQHSRERRGKTNGCACCSASNGCEFMPFKKAEAQKVSCESARLIYNQMNSDPVTNLAGSFRGL